MAASPSDLLTPEVRAALTAGHLAHLVTLEADGTPHVTIVWVGLDGDEIVAGHLGLHHKVRNMQADPRVALSLETGGRTEHGLDQYLVVNGRGAHHRGRRARAAAAPRPRVPRARRGVPAVPRPARRVHHPDHGRVARRGGPLGVVTGARGGHCW